MTQNSKRPEFTSYKRKFNVGQMYEAATKVPSALSGLSFNNKNNLLSEQFVERLQLAVTEVNGCAACSYAHTRMALDMGMTKSEINSFLIGDTTYVSDEEAIAIMFAQHYADSRSFLDRVAYQKVLEEYGQDKTRVILAAIQIIYFGNAYGISMSALSARLRGKAYKDSSLLYEVGMIISGLLVLPFALLHGVIKLLLKQSPIKFNDDIK